MIDPQAQNTSTEGSSSAAYRRSLLVLLSVATFFEGYDFMAISQVLPNIRATFDLAPEWAGYLVAVVNVGTILAYPLIRLADRIGRRRVLSITIAGYALLTFASGLAPTAPLFALSQLAARAFLVAEWALSVVVIAEEFPSLSRGAAVGIVSAVGSLGAVACAAAVPALVRTPLGWRTVYLVGVAPLLLLARARRGLRETRRFADEKTSTKADLVAPLTGRYRARTLVVGALWFLTYVPVQNGTAFFKEFAVAERGWSNTQVAAAISLGAIVSLPIAFLVGRMSDAIGRRRVAVLVYGCLGLGAFGTYTASSRWALTLLLVVGMTGAASAMPLLNTLTTELFPTEIRSGAFAVTNNVLGRIGYVAAPLLVGVLVTSLGWANAIRPAAIGAATALVLVLVAIPETKGKTLEETARIV